MPTHGTSEYLQLTRLSIMVAAEIGSITKPGAKKPPAVDLFRSVVLV